MKKSGVGLVTTLGLILGAIGVLAPIAWDWYKSRSALELQLLSNSVIVSPVEGIALSFVYDGRLVPSLSRLEFSLVNTGRTPIRETDVVSPVVVTVQTGKIVDFQVSQLRPDNLLLQHVVSDDAQSISLSFPLLNSGDSFRFVMFVSASQPMVICNARIAGLSRLDFIDRSEATSRSLPTFGWSFYVVGIVTTILLIALFGSFALLGGEDSIAKLAKGDAVKVPTTGTAGEYLSFLSKAFSGEKSTELRPVRSYLTNLPTDRALTDLERATMVALLKQALLDTSAVAKATVFVSILFVVGAAYTVWTVFAALRSH